MNRLFIAAAFLAACCYGQQTPRATISGTVTDLGGQPLKNASVRLQGQPQSYATSTDEQGNFLFENLEPAGYTLSAEHTGYLRTTYSTNSRGASTQLDLSSGQQLNGIAVKMTPQGVIAGRITNEDDEPFPNVWLQLTHWVYLNGRRQLQPVNGVSVPNADGAFAIGNLAAGVYYLSVFDRDSPFGETLRGHEGPVKSYVTTYYPGVTDPSAATAIEVSAGAVIRGVDIRMRQSVLYRVAGKVVDPSSPDPPPDGYVVMSPKDAINLGAAPVANSRKGAFEFSGVLPGVYILQATAFQGSPLAGRQLVTVGNGDVEGIVVQLGRGTEITGQILTEGSSAPAKPGAAEVNPRPVVVLEPIDSSGDQVTQAEKDGTFALPGIPAGLYRVEVNALTFRNRNIREIDPLRWPGRDEDAARPELGNRRETRDPALAQRSGHKRSRPRPIPGSQRRARCRRHRHAVGTGGFYSDRRHRFQRPIPIHRPPAG